MKSFLIVIIILFVCALHLHAQKSEEVGFPIITNFKQKDFGGTNLTTGIGQDSRGVMYFGNNQSLIEYDGVNWRRHFTTKNNMILTLAVGNDDAVYVGGTQDIGYFKSNEHGKLEYHSIKEFLPQEKRDFSQVNQVYIVDRNVYFKTFNFYNANFVFIWDAVAEEFSEIITEDVGSNILLLNKAIYQLVKGKGLGQMLENKFVLLPNGDFLADKAVITLIPFNSPSIKILVVTADQGLFIYDGTNFSSFNTPAYQYLIENIISTGLVIDNGNIMIGTYNNGLVEINLEGNVIRRYNKESGLQNNLVFNIFKDRSNDVWITTQNGISKLAMSSPILLCDERLGLTSNIQKFVRHKGKLYAGGYINGFFSFNTFSGQFEEIQALNNDQITCILPLKDELILATSSGLIMLKNNRIISMFPNDTRVPWVNEMQSSEFHNGKIFISTLRGVWVLSNKNKQWINQGQFIETKSQVISVVEIDETKLWVGTEEGLFLIKYNLDGTGEIKLSESDKINNEAGYRLQKGKVTPFKINDEVYFATQDSLYIFDKAKNQFIADSSNTLIRYFMNFPLNQEESKMIKKDNLGNIWIYSKSRISMGVLQDDYNFRWVTTPFNRIIGEGISLLFAEGHGIFWFNTYDGLIRFDLEQSEKLHHDFPSLIRHITVSGDSILYYGGLISNLSPQRIKFSNNSIRFDFSASRFEPNSMIRFSTLLEGQDNNWTTWSTETFKEFANLSPGSYTFRVKALDAGGMESLPATYSFIILPPWYLTWWSYVLYLVLLVGFVYMYSRWRTQELKKVNLALEQKVKDRTWQLEKKSNDLSESLVKLKSTQTQLIHAEKMASLGELTAGIAHEIQNPLNFVNNFSEVSLELIDELRSELDEVKSNVRSTPQDQMTFVQERLQEAEHILNDLAENQKKINHHGNRADAIVKGMLMHSRSGSGQKEPTDINALVDEYLRLSYHGLRAKDKSFNAAFETHFDTNLPKVEVMPQDIGRVLLNLINNAFYAVDQRNRSMSGLESDYKPTIVVSTKNLGDKIEISVQDNGQGIPEEIKDKIFQPFFTTKPTGQGTGLGLSISYDIIKAHQGEIKINSNDRHRGTDFIVTLPIITE